MSNSKKNRSSLSKTLNIDVSDNIQPLTDNQAIMFESEQDCVANGSAGTGKTFIALYKALKSVLRYGSHKKVVIIRSAVPTRNLGFMPGDAEEKVAEYESPYDYNVRQICKRQDAYEYLKTKGIIDFMCTSFIRGTTMDDSIIIADECQNMSYHELDSIITRLGKNSRIFFCGDMYQADLERNGLKKFFDVLKTLPSYDFIEFTTDDIVRSSKVKEYLEAKLHLYGTQNIA